MHYTLGSDYNEFPRVSNKPIIWFPTSYMWGRVEIAMKRKKTYGKLFMLVTLLLAVFIAPVAASINEAKNQVDSVTAYNEYERARSAYESELVAQRDTNREREQSGPVIAVDQQRQVLDMFVIAADSRIRYAQSVDESLYDKLDASRERLANHRVQLEHATSVTDINRINMQVRNEWQQVVVPQLQMQAMTTTLDRYDFVALRLEQLLNRAESAGHNVEDASLQLMSAKRQLGMTRAILMEAEPTPRSVRMLIDEVEKSQHMLLRVRETLKDSLTG